MEANSRSSFVRNYPHKNAADVYDLSSEQEVKKRDNAYASAFETFEENANHGCSMSQYELGVMFAQGIGVERNGKNAFLWSMAAYNQHHPDACTTLGDLFQQGHGVEKNVEFAIFYYREGAKRGSASACNNLGKLYLYGLGVEQNFQTAKLCFEEAVRSDYADAYNNIGIIHEYGYGVSKDTKQAMNYYRAAFQNGCSIAQSNFERLQISDDREVRLQRESEQGQKKQQQIKPEAVKREKIAESAVQSSKDTINLVLKLIEQKKFSEALPVLQKLANEGRPVAQYQLGRLFYYGVAVAQNFERAIGWFYKAARQDSADACNKIAVMFRDGQGVERNERMSVAWCREGIALNSAQAFTGLGYMYEKGRGVTKDLDQAFKLYSKGAELGSASAFYHLGVMYEQGLVGLCKQPWRALENYQIAIDLGCDQGLQNLNSLSKLIYEKNEPLAEKDSDAAFQLGLLYLNGWHVWQDLSRGRDYLQSAHQLGNKDALFMLGKWFMQKAIFESQILFDAFNNPEVKHISAAGLVGYRNAAIAYLEKAASHGHSEAWFTLGEWHEKDHASKAHDYYVLAVMKNNHKKAAEKVAFAMLQEASCSMQEGAYKSAFDLYKPLATCGYAEAQLQLGVMYMQGRHVYWNHEQAEFFLRQAYKSNPKRCDEVLGPLLVKASHFIENKNHKFAFNLYKPMAACGYVEARLQLGLMYMQGLHVSRDNEKAKSFLIEAQELDANRLEELLAPLLIKASDFILNKRFEDAFQLYDSIAGIGNAEAQLQLGLMYMYGLHVKQSDTQTELNLAKAANQGNVEAAFRLGNWWSKERPYYKQDFQQAIKWYEYGSRLNHANSSIELGLMNVPRNKKLTFLELAYKQGHPRAAYELAYFYAYNSLIKSEEDLVQAEKWAVIAVDMNADKAQELLADVRKKLESIRRTWF
ncbi:MAG: Sel1 domain protein repeat-containing protein [Solimicrobium sp.]|jgi:TPR repeat protein|nr:Sel1 domain protein repeat-containing protein [Solimicrobium sp.]